MNVIDDSIPPDVKSWLIGTDPDAGKDWGQGEKGTTEDEMVGWHHRLDGHIWVNSGSWLWTGRSGMLRFMGLQRVRHDWATELTELTDWYKENLHQSLNFTFLKTKSKVRIIVQIVGLGGDPGNYLLKGTLMAESKEELKSLLLKVKEESKKAGLKLNIQKMKIMASGPITSWQIDGGKVEAVTDFTFLGSKITVDDACSHEIQRRLLLERKAITTLDSILKSRDITLLTKIWLVKATVFPVVMYGCESWTIKKAECKELMLSNWGAGEDSWESLGILKPVNS